jgi:hypothetical protein
MVPESPWRVRNAVNVAKSSESVAPMIAARVSTWDDSQTGYLAFVLELSLHALEGLIAFHSTPLGELQERHRSLEVESPN